MSKGFDCATKLTKTAAVLLKKEGFEYVARYLGNSWKTFDKAEAKVIQDAGLKLISIFEKNSTSVKYFTKAQGISDAKEAMKLAKAVGQPTGTAIYFTVDYDAQSSHMDEIKAYLQGIKETIKDYKVGLYGSYSVMQAVKGLVDYYWQTCAWSNKKVADHIHMHQHQVDVTVAGVKLDRNDIKKVPGAWCDQVKAVTNNKPYKVIIPNTAFWQAEKLVIEYEVKGYKCYGHALKKYGPNQKPAKNDPYQFIVETTHEQAVKLVIELKTKGYDKAYGTEIK